MFARQTLQEFPQPGRTVLGFNQFTAVDFDRHDQAQIDDHKRSEINFIQLGDTIDKHGQKAFLH